MEILFIKRFSLKFMSLVIKYDKQKLVQNYRQIIVKITVKITVLVFSLFSSLARINPYSVTKIFNNTIY